VQQIVYSTIAAVAAACGTHYSADSVA